MPKFRVNERTKSMTRDALVCRSLGTHALEGIDTAGRGRLKGASLVVDLYCKRYNPDDPQNPHMCGYHREVEYSLRNGEVVGSQPRYPSEGYLQGPEWRGQGAMDRGDARLALFDRMSDPRGDG